ncbi:hypothetical protein FB567DRAFT_609902 [Paraphoma chrysanthemicola]|uniref:Uncharacterized protein n=1 Tax=Paraphoma chrysanthemicola TaxID=798071 RepID=A0A8K0RIE0_9PLEO|nr:hypothetical protein FB567DRAFT_609902 [Paraphoma chrysanthemicola]
MARVGFSTLGLYPLPTVPSTLTTRATFQLVNGVTVPRSVDEAPQASSVHLLRNSSIASNECAHKSFLSKVRGLSLAWLAPARRKPDSPPFKFVVGDINEQRTHDGYLSSTVLLRSLPLTSDVLSEVGSTDLTTHALIIDQLVGSKGTCTIGVIQKIKEELHHAVRLGLIQPAGQLHQRQSSFPTCSSPSFIERLASRRGQPGMVLNDIFNSKTNNEEQNFALFCHKPRENPDFPLIPVWNKDHVVQRERLDFIQQLTEDASEDIFTHETFVSMVWNEMCSTKSAPHPERLLELRNEAAAESFSMIKQEYLSARISERQRLLRVKIEPLLPKVGGTLKKDMAIQTVKILRAEMMRSMQDAAAGADLKKEYISDLISNYSEDVDEDYCMKPEVIDALCNEHKRESIKAWALKTDASGLPHVIFNNFGGKKYVSIELCDISDEVGKAGDYPWRTECLYPDYPWGPKEEHMIDWKIDEITKTVVLPLDDGYPDERSEGFFTNMSGLSDISVSESESTSSDSEGGGSKVQRDSQTSSEELQPQADRTRGDFESEEIENNCQDEPTRRIDSLIGNFIGINTEDNVFGPGPIIEKSFQTTAKPLDYTKKLRNTKLAAVKAGKHIGLRRFNNLRSAWDIPHHSHGAELPGYRGHRTFSRPTPDWDAPEIEKPAFAQRREAVGMLTQFNLEKDQEELSNPRTRNPNVPDMSVKVAQCLPRRPLYEGRILNNVSSQSHIGASIFQQKHTPQPHVEYKIGTMDAEGRVRICSCLVHTPPNPPENPIQEPVQDRATFPWTDPDIF